MTIKEAIKKLEEKGFTFKSQVGCNKKFQKENEIITIPMKKSVKEILPIHLQKKIKQLVGCLS